MDLMEIGSKFFYSAHDKADHSVRLKLKHNVYWDVAGKVKKGPYCKECHESKSTLILLQKSHWLGEHWYYCRSCNKYFLKK